MTLITTDKVFKFVDATKTRKSKYRENDTFFPRIKKSFFIKGIRMATNNFLAEVTFKDLMVNVDN